MINTKDKAIIKNYCEEQIKEKDKIRVRSLALLLIEHYALYEIMKYIKEDLCIDDKHILRSNSTYMSQWHGHKRISKNDVFYGNVYWHQYVIHKAFDVTLETLGKYIIHHCDLDKHNNNLSNLWIFYNSELHRKFHIELSKNPNVSIIKYTKNWVEENLNAENYEELTEYLKLLLRIENDKKCLGISELDNAI